MRRNIPLRLVARLNLLHQGRVTAFIRTPYNPTLTPISLLIDTGATYTSLLPGDVIRLGIPYEKLKASRSRLAIAIGEVQPLLLNDVNLYVTVLEGGVEQFLALNFETIRVIPPMKGYAIPASGAYSLLGMDVLKHFSRWRFEGDRLFLDSEQPKAGVLPETNKRYF